MKRAVLQKQGSFSLSSFEGSDPELCITLFKNTQNFIGLKTRIKSADQKWMEEFLEQGGLETVFSSLVGLGMPKVTYTFIDAVRQLECMGCIKAIMNHPFGMEYAITVVGKKVFYKLIEGTVRKIVYFYYYSEIVNFKGCTKG